MNENIKKLIDSSKKDISGKWIDVTHVETLIASTIEECITICNSVSSYSRDEYTNGARHAGNVLKQHFGIE